MSITATYDEFKDKLMPVLEMKKEEFLLLGYDEVGLESIWKCTVSRTNRKFNESVRLHVFVNQMLGLSVNDYMNWLRVDSLKGPDWFASGEPFKLDEFDEPST